MTTIKLLPKQNRVPKEKKLCFHIYDGMTKETRLRITRLKYWINSLEEGIIRYPIETILEEQVLLKRLEQWKRELCELKRGCR